MTPEERHELMKEVADAFMHRYLQTIRLDTTSVEYQHLAGELGTLIGRMGAVALWEGPLNSDLLMHMRHCEKSGREEMQKVFRKMTGPGGSISKALMNRE